MKFFSFKEKVDDLDNWILIINQKKISLSLSQKNKLFTNCRKEKS